MTEIERIEVEGTLQDVIRNQNNSKFDLAELVIENLKTSKNESRMFPWRWNIYEGEHGMELTNITPLQLDLIEIGKQNSLIGKRVRYVRLKEDISVGCVRCDYSLEILDGHLKGKVYSDEMFFTPVIPSEDDGRLY